MIELIIFKVGQPSSVNLPTAIAVPNGNVIQHESLRNRNVLQVFSTSNFVEPEARYGYKYNEIIGTIDLSAVGGIYDTYAYVYIQTDES